MKTNIQVSSLILTLNEEINLPKCLESVAWSDDIVVFDSFSTDRTVEIARAAGARVIQRKFDNYASQRNAALAKVKYKYPWVLMVDADERPTPELVREIQLTVESDNDEVTMYRVRRKDMFLGKWLRRSSGYPTLFGRLFRTGKVTVEREINEEYHTDGKIGYLKEHFIHYPFNKGTAFWFERHNRYSSMEAEAFVKEVRDKLRFEDLFSSDPTIRRKFLKQLAFHLPCRPFIVFCYLYFVKLGFLDGIPGFTYCRLRTIYEYMISVKVKELQRREKGLPV
jgi:glycosyltransferase involved in cell wall biosynthesis